MSKEKLSFKDYFESKQRLKTAGDNCPRYFSVYEVNKYCKIPLSENPNDEEKTYIALKPKDKLKILWEMLDFKNPVPKHIAIIDEDLEETKYHFTWNLPKIHKWLSTTTHKK